MALTRSSTANLLAGALNFHPDLAQQIADQIAKIQKQQETHVAQTYRQNKLEQQRVFAQQPTHQEKNQSQHQQGIQQPHSNKGRRR